MNSASARLEAFPEAFDEKIRRRFGPELGPLDFCEELSIDVAADVLLGGVALIGHKGFPSSFISNSPIAWRNVVNPSSRTGFIAREPLVGVFAISSPFGMASFLGFLHRAAQIEPCVVGLAGLFESMEAPVSQNRLRDGTEPVPPYQSSIVASRIARFWLCPNNLADQFAEP